MEIVPENIKEKKEQMEADMIGEKNSMRKVFDEILFKHMERLIGSRYGLGELPLNSVTISLIMLLIERENEIESFPPGEIDRYEIETLITNFEELGFDADQDMNIVVEEMVRKDYIHIDDDKLVAKKPTISMAKLIDLVFPKMPGMNLVAYFVQTMDEVKSKRKELGLAADQFDQVLQMQGVPLKKAPQQSRFPSVFAKSSDKEIYTHKSDKSQRYTQKLSPENKLKTSTILGRNVSDSLSDQNNGFSSEKKVLSSNVYKGKIEIKKVDFGTPILEEVEPKIKPSDEREHIEDKDLGIKVKRSGTKKHGETVSIISDTELTTSSEEPVKTVVDEQIPSMDTVTSRSAIIGSDLSNIDALHDLKSIEQDKIIVDDLKEDSLKMESFDKNIEGEKVTDESDSAKPFENEASSVNDHDIETRIVAFEEDLALKCPLCRYSKIKVENTATGKSYYKCSNKECNFISWGKPHHISCPRCNNPFLIETSNKNDKTILKCPRATCRYWKKIRFDTEKDLQESIESGSQRTNKIISIPRKPRRKVVRRRVVRKKK